MHLIYVTQESCYENDFTLSDMQLQRAVVLDVIGAFTESQLSCPGTGTKHFFYLNLQFSRILFPFFIFLLQLSLRQRQSEEPWRGERGIRSWNMYFYCFMINNVPALHLWNESFIIWCLIWLNSQKGSLSGDKRRWLRSVLMSSKLAAWRISSVFTSGQM